MDSRTCVPVRPEFSQKLPDHLQADDLRLSEHVLRFLIERYTKAGEAILDPFAGFGTTLLVSEQFNRLAFGVEQDRSRWLYATQVLSKPERMLYGDVRALTLEQFPRFSLIISSPIYMNCDDCLDPLSGFSKSGSYQSYIRELTDIYDRLRAHCVSGGHLIIEAANLKREGVTTMFAWDLARALAERVHFEGEIVLDWAHHGYGFGYTHSYCLVFQT